LKVVVYLAIVITRKQTL